MTDEEMERKMEFIIEQQAQFVVNFQKLEEAQTRGERRTSELEGAVVAIVNIVGRLAEAQERTDARISELAEAQTRLTDAQERTESALAETNERLNAFIVVVERYITNGRSEPSS